jgi:hypothetical protein
LWRKYFWSLPHPKLNSESAFSSSKKTQDVVPVEEERKLCMRAKLELLIRHDLK